jgi:spore maturation protein CgeB
VKLAGNWQAVTDSSPLLPFLVDPRGECCDNTETAQRYCSTLTSANLYRVEADRPELSAGWAVGPREIELAACGTWFGRNPRGEGDALFPMLPTFTDPDELGPLIRWALNHPEERYAATVKAYAAIADRTFDHNAAELLQLLGV